MQAAKIGTGDKSGFLTLNFDWLYWPLFKMNGIELLTPDLKQTAFDTPQMLDGDRSAGQGDRDPGDRQDLLDRTLGGTARCVLIRQGRHAARAFAGLFVHQGPGSLGQPATRSASHKCRATGRFPTATAWASPPSPNSPSSAWELLNFITERTAGAWPSRARSRCSTGNTAVDQQLLTDMRSADPLGAAVLETQLQYTDKMCGNWRAGRRQPGEGRVLARSAERAARSPRSPRRRSMPKRSGMSSGFCSAPESEADRSADAALRRVGASADVR